MKLRLHQRLQNSVEHALNGNLPRPHLTRSLSNLLPDLNATSVLNRAEVAHYIVAAIIPNQVDITAIKW
mgnify:CR=1 FL=1